MTLSVTRPIRDTVPDDREPPETPSRVGRRRRWPAILAGFLAVVVVAEIGARIIEDRITPAEEFAVAPLSEHVAAIEAMEGPVDVLFVGSSVAGADIDPSLLEISGTAYTAWGGGLTGRSLDLVTREVLVPIARPHTVVVVVTSREVNDNGITTAFGNLTASPAFRRIQRSDTALGEVEQALIDHSAFLRIRGALRQPATVAEELRGGGVADIAPDGQSFEWPASRGAERYAPDRIRLETLALSDFEVGGPELTALDDMVAWLGEEEIAVVLLNAPVTDRWIALHPGGAADYERYLTALAGLAERRGVDLIDASDLHWDEELFADVNHLNPNGAERLTALVSDHLSSLETD